MRLWKVCCLALASCLWLGVQAGELESQMGHCCCAMECVPEGWEFDDCKLYQPQPSIICWCADNGQKIMTVTDICGPRGFNLCLSDRFCAKAGDVVHGHAWVRGHGVGWFAVQSYHGDECQSAMSRKKLPLTDVWRKVRFSLPVKVLPTLASPDNVMFMFGAEPGAEVCVTNLKFSVPPEVFSGDRVEMSSDEKSVSQVKPQEYLGGGGAVPEA